LSNCPKPAVAEYDSHRSTLLDSSQLWHSHEHYSKDDAVSVSAKQYI
jgi:hypothetical protein